MNIFKKLTLERCFGETTLNLIVDTNLNVNHWSRHFSRNRGDRHKKKTKENTHHYTKKLILFFTQNLKPKEFNLYLQELFLSLY